MAATHPLGCACWEVWQHEREGAHKHARQLVDHGDLFKDGAGVVERCQKGDMPVADACRILHEQVREAIRKVPARQGMRTSGHSARVQQQESNRTPVMMQLAAP